MYFSHGAFRVCLNMSGNNLVDMLDRVLATLACQVLKFPLNSI